MKDYTICICDDEKAICEQLKTYIVRYSFLNNLDIDIIVLDSAKKLFSCPSAYDILFLDIRFGNDSIGIDVGERLRLNGNTSIIIIMTILESMALEGYRAEPFRFVLKPLTENQIYDILTTCIKKISRTVTFLKVMNDSHTSLIRTDRIMYIYSKARKRQIVCIADESLSTWQNLNELMEYLPKEKFIYSQKSYIVNLDMIYFVKDGKIFLNDRTSIPVSTHYIDGLMKKLLKNSVQGG